MHNQPATEGHSRRFERHAGSIVHSAPRDPAGAFQPVLTIRESVRPDEVAAFTRDALREIRSYIEAHHLEVEGPPFSIHHGTAADRVDVEAGWPVRGAPGSGRIHRGALPAGWLRGPDLPAHPTAEAAGSAACADTV